MPVIWVDCYGFRCSSGCCEIAGGVPKPSINLAGRGDMAAWREAEDEAGNFWQLSSYW